MDVKLTQYSHGAGCGCKISPKLLQEILNGAGMSVSDPNLLVGNAESDDAAVYDMEDGSAIISTTDFFMPIVDDAFDFGRIASVNAISDIYAMGGQPLVAIAILGWPIDKLPPEVASQVLAGARAACKSAGIALGGGHSIDSPEPIFGLAVTGKVQIKDLKRNNSAKAGDILFLTKPLGVGILTTAQKKGLLKPEHSTMARDSMVKLNAIGQTLSAFPQVHAMTDVTGFGLGGHLVEMCTGSEVHARIKRDAMPLLHTDAIEYYIDQKCIPGGTGRNFASYGHHIEELSDRDKAIICDPQTSGGLLIAVDPNETDSVVQVLKDAELNHTPIGTILDSRSSDVMISVDQVDQD